MKNLQHFEDISEIRQMMEKSSRFISLSGLSGVLAGVFALFGGYLAHRGLSLHHQNPAQHTSEMLIIHLSLIAAGVLLFSLIGGILLTVQKARKKGQSIWDPVAKRMLLNLIGPLTAGGLFSIALILNHHFLFVAPTLLIFYGLALINASKYTLHNIQFLGYAQVILGLIASFILGHGVYFWSLGFGVFHIIYGIFMHFKYDR